MHYEIGAQKRSADRISLPNHYMFISLFIGLAGFGVWVSWKAVHYGVGTLTSPGVGGWPLIVGLAITALSIWSTLLERKFPSEGAFNFGRPVALWFLVLLLCVLINFITFIISTTLVLFVVFKVLGKASWWVSVLYPSLISSVIYLIFNVILSVPLP